MATSLLPLLLLAILIVIQIEADQLPLPTFIPNYKDYDTFWTDKQCRIWDTKHRQTWHECNHLCELEVQCTAYNWKKDAECEIMDCGTYPPFPIGEQRGKNRGKTGLSHYWIGTSGRYYGPYGVFWEDDQCDVIGIENDQTRVLCEGMCDMKPGCSGFNFNRDNGNCVFRKCNTTPPPPPKGVRREWESFSKVQITKPHAPDVKCPSFDCKREDIPVEQVNWATARRLRYCNRGGAGECNCWKNVYCYYFCSKCGIFTTNG